MHLLKKSFDTGSAFARREARETKYWLQMIVAAAPDCRLPARKLWREAHELHLIFCAILRKTS